jgi:hypothetical protein
VNAAARPQLELPFAEPDDRTIAARFAEFDAANPRVYTLFVRFAREVRRARPRYSADAILHRIRWEIALTTVSDDGFKINNVYSSRYARKLMKEFPDEFGGFFQLRKLRSE